MHNIISLAYGTYSNRLSTISVSRDGADYESRTGLAPISGLVSGFSYDANGNLTKDPSRDIVLIKYNHLNLPTDVYFGNGQRQTIEYFGNGVKKSVSYSQTTASVVGGNIPADDKYSVTTKRTYVGPHIYTDEKLEYSSFGGGYFEPGKGAQYYVPDWQGNNVGVIDNNGKLIETTTYYPYGEPTKEPTGQRFLYGGKEREHGGGRNSYDFSARCLIAPLGQWGVPDPKAENYFSYSPYSYCAGDPINYIDPDGNEITIIEESDGDKVRQLKMRISGVVYNASSGECDLKKLAKAIETQLNDVFTVAVDGMKVTMNAEIRVANSVNEITTKDHVISIVDLVSKEQPTALASTNGIGGMSIKISRETAEKTISGENRRTIAHEVGHSAGLSHTNGLSSASNLMTQMRYLDRNIDPNLARDINVFQVNKIVDYYYRGKLNLKSPLHVSFNISIQKQWPFFNVRNGGKRLNL